MVHSKHLRDVSDCYQEIKLTKKWLYFSRKALNIQKVNSTSVSDKTEYFYIYFYLEYLLCIFESAQTGRIKVIIIIEFTKGTGELLIQSPKCWTAGCPWVLLLLYPGMSKTQ